MSGDIFTYATVSLTRQLKREAFVEWLWMRVATERRKLDQWGQAFSLDISKALEMIGQPFMSMGLIRVYTSILIMMGEMEGTSGNLCVYVAPICKFGEAAVEDVLRHAVREAVDTATFSLPSAPSASVVGRRMLREADKHAWASMIPPIVEREPCRACE